ncbi:SPOR domain-containing protein [Scleromatobacter humisilvae]|uniref:SPOR domain-containing protein n=1 Tax=Scleromatobacter humisilvae TaxID=2897159 RepID=A0A9X1YQU6_9BURK|nr:SPOR domain-containing protein [Scleromatobacter humisilvae]MCK9689713.1 SPOR domain-containing protein [Scleromatobacter humisilvae]
MGLLSIFQRNKQTSAQAPKGRGAKSAARQAPLANAQNPADTAEAMREVRARARTRLMGATVLLLIGVIGFPLLFETQPRPIPVDLPIEIPARNAAAVVDASSHASRNPVSAAPLAASLPTPESVSYDARPSAPVAASAPAAAASTHRSAFASLASALGSGSSSAGTAPASAAYVAPSMGGSSSTVAQTKPAAKPVKPAASAAATVAASKPSPALHTTGPVLPPAIAASRPSPAAILADSATNPPDAAANGGRFVVQVGAFLEDAKVRETRAKVEKLGMKTYTQGVDTPTGKRIRVRVGPVATKAEADKIAAKLKADGLQAVVLAL